MGVPKIKNMIIAALVLLNLFFLAIIVYDRADDARRERQALEDACAILAAAGVSIDPGDVDAAPGLRVMRTARDLAAERVIAEAVLGEVTESEQGGILYLYDNEENGGAVFKSGGEFTITVNEGVYPAVSDGVSVARGLMRRMGLEFADFEVADDGEGGQTVTARCAYRGARIFNCFVSFRFTGGSLRVVFGKYAPGISEAEDAAVISSPATALMTFLSAVKKGEIGCARIEGAAAGYFARDATAFGDGSLTPAWLVTADSGRYIVDTGTGEIRLMPEARLVSQ